MGNLGDGLKVGNIVSWIPDSLNINSLGPVINSCNQVFWFVSFHKLGLDAQTWQQDFKLVVRSTIQISGCDNVVAMVGKGRYGHELSGLAGGCSKGTNSTFQSCNTFLKDIDGWLKDD